MDHQSESQYKEHFKRHTRPQTFDSLKKTSKKARTVGISDTSTELETTVCVIETLSLMMIKCVPTLITSISVPIHLMYVSHPYPSHPPLDISLSLTTLTPDL